MKKVQWSMVVLLVALAAYVAQSHIEAPADNAGMLKAVTIGLIALVCVVILTRKTKVEA